MRVKVKESRLTFALGVDWALASLTPFSKGRGKAILGIDILISCLVYSSHRAGGFA